jgi:Leucine-rich repeat (LRR) protein
LAESQWPVSTTSLELSVNLIHFQFFLLLVFALSLLHSLDRDALKVLELVHCGLTKLDPSLALAPRLYTLSVAHNDLQTLAHLENCPLLALVNVSHNRLSSVAGAHRYLAAVASVDLSHNALASTARLEKMFTLQRLDLSYNAIPTTAEVAYLVSLPLLHDLSLVENPFFDVPYRIRILDLLGKGLVVDNAPWSAAELNLVDRQHPPTIDTVHSPQDAVDVQTNGRPLTGRSSSPLGLHDLRAMFCSGNDVGQSILSRTSVLCGLLVRTYDISRQFA